MSLPPVIEKMQAVRRKVDILEAPLCADAARAKLADYMDKTTDGYLAFMAQKADSEVSAIFTQARDKQSAFFAALVELR